MIQRAIELAFAANIGAKVFVSTDDEEIASLSTAAGASVPFFRPIELADDYMGTTPVIAHAVNTLELSNEAVVCCLYPTVPLLKANRLAEGFRRLSGDVAEFVFAALQFETAPQRALRLDADGETTAFLPDFIESRSQDLEPLYHDAGQFYWASAETWRAQKHPFGCRSKVVVLDRAEVCDIDTEVDWVWAEALYTIRRQWGR